MFESSVENLQTSTDWVEGPSVPAGATICGPTAPGAVRATKNGVSVFYTLSPVTSGESIASDGSTASYYELPAGATELQHLISHRDMNAQIGEIFRAAYRYGQASHSDKLRDAKKIKFYAEAEIARLEKLK